MDFGIDIDFIILFITNLLILFKYIKRKTLEDI